MSDAPKYHPEDEPVWLEFAKEAIRTVGPVMLTADAEFIGAHCALVADKLVESWRARFPDPFRTVASVPPPSSPRTP